MRQVLPIMMLLFALVTGFQYKTLAQESVGTACKTECNTCASTCKQTLNYCHDKQGKHIKPAHIKALQDCISSCKQSADFIARESELQSQACKLCQKACTRCAELCEEFKDDKTMQDCAEECRKCADACKKMSS